MSAEQRQHLRSQSKHA